MYRALQALAAVLVLGTTTGVLAQTPANPTKPIPLIVPYPAGGPLDTAAQKLLIPAALSIVRGFRSKKERA